LPPAEAELIPREEAQELINCPYGPHAEVAREPPPPWHRSVVVRPARQQNHGIDFGWVTAGIEQRELAPKAVAGKQEFLPRRLRAKPGDNRCHIHVEDLVVAEIVRADVLD